MGIECVDKTINGHSVYPCPWCGYYDLYVDNICKKFFVGCAACGARGPMADTIEEAIEKWNEQVDEEVVIAAAKERIMRDGAGLEIKEWYKNYAKLQICPFCESENVEILEIPKTIYDKPYAGYCRDCGGRGSVKDTKEEAIAVWNSIPRKKAEKGIEQEGGGASNASDYVAPMPVVRDESGKTNYQSVKALFLKINEELDELKEAVCGYNGAQVAFDDNVMREGAIIGISDKERIAEEACDTITAITTLLEALGINAGMRVDAQQRVNDKNRKRGRL